MLVIAILVLMAVVTEIIIAVDLYLVTLQSLAEVSACNFMQDNNGSVFNRIRVEKPGYSQFNLSYDNKLSMRMGKLIPVHIQEVVPGDRFTMSSEAMLRLMPMLAPIMHKVDLFFHNFFVPNRILWANWEKYITGGESIATVPPAFPVFDDLSLSLGGVAIAPSSIWNYLGLPAGVSISSPISAIPVAGYQRIFYEFYRDQNLDVFDPVMLNDGPQSGLNFAYYNELRDRAWEHDYFTSCLPFAQKGAAIEMPANITGLDVAYRDPVALNAIWRDASGAPGAYDSLIGTGNLAGGAPPGVSSFYHSVGGFPTPTEEAFYDPGDTLFIDESNVSIGATINDLRTAFSLQKWLEKNARAGSRYIETILAHFGVQSSDKRLQRPEYLGGSSATLQISEVLQTSSTDATTAQGNMAGHGVSVTGGFQHSYRCEEHGYIHTILSVRPKTAYYQGVPKHFRKFEREEFYWPDFAFLGEQEVLKGELGWRNASSDDDVFGYIPRYSEYRYNPSRVAGQMATTLDFWHMGRKLDLTVAPALNKDFISCGINVTDRIFAVDDPTNDVIVAHIFHNINAVRPMPKYGTPGSI